MADARLDPEAVVKTMAPFSERIADKVFRNSNYFERVVEK